MIFVDYRAGSEELIEPLRKLGLDIEETRLEFGDLAFEGRGEKGKQVSIGIEFKKLEELVGAIRTERLQGHQVLGMRPTYDHAYLLIEGELLYGSTGHLQVRTGRFRELETMPGSMTAGELLKRVQVLHLCGGMNPCWTNNRADTLQNILALYRVWTDTDLDQHKSHLGIYIAPMVIPVSDTRRTLTTFPGIGRKLSGAVEERFGSLANACEATEAEWAEIETTDDKGHKRKLGHKLAEEIVRFVHNE